MTPQDGGAWRVDIAVRDAMRAEAAHAPDAVRGLARGANWWGGPGVIWFGAVVWLGARALRRRTASRLALRGLEALAVASGLSAITKGLAGRARPFLGDPPWHWEFNHGWTDARFFSMPSGHTTATAAFAVGVLLAGAGLAAGPRLAVAAPLLLSAVLVAWARMFTDQHWLSDVAAGVIIGVGVAITLARVHARRPSPRYDRVMLGVAPEVTADGVESPT